MDWSSCTLLCMHVCNSWLSFVARPQHCCRSVCTSLVTQDDNSALHLAAGRGYLQTVKYLLPIMWDSRYDKNQYGQTCLELAQRWGAKEVVTYLTEQGLDASSTP